MTNLLILKVRRVYLILIILFSTVGCDQATKAVARDAISISGSISYLSSTVRLEHAENPGAFLSLGAQLPQQLRSLIFIGMVSFFLLFLCIYLFKNSSGFVSTAALSMVLAGGIGNLIDRIHKGTVTDFIVLKNSYVSTGIFNIADVAIVFGGLILLVISYNQENQTECLKSAH